MKLLLHLCYFTLFSSLSLPPSLWTFILLLTSLLFFLSALLQPYLHTQQGFDIFLFLFLFAASFLHFFLHFFSLVMSLVGCPTTRARGKVRWRETITTGCIWQREPSQSSIIELWTVWVWVCLQMCMCASVSTWNYGCPWDRRQPLKLQTASISISEVAKKTVR